MRKNNHLGRFVVLLIQLLVSTGPATGFAIVALHPHNHHPSSNMVNFHGHISLRLSARRGISESKIQLSEPPPDPNKLLNLQQLEEKAQLLIDWWRGKSNVFCITGAGLSTESGIPDYRGHEGSYHRGHKPVIHQQYMESEYQRQRYWGRSMIGWSKFNDAKPNVSFFCTLSIRFLINFCNLSP